MWLPWRGCEGSAPTAAAGLDGSGGVGTGAGHAGGSIVPTAVVHRPYKPATNLLEGWAA